MATLYFYGLDDNIPRSWQTASYWKTSDSPSGTASATIPASGDTVIIRRMITSVPATLNLNSITIDIPRNKSYPTSSYGGSVANFTTCTNLTTASGLYIKYNNNLSQKSAYFPDYDYEQSASIMFGMPSSSGTWNTKFDINYNGAHFPPAVGGDFRGMISFAQFFTTNQQTNLVLNGDFSATGILPSGTGSLMPYIPAYWNHNSGNFYCENAGLLFAFGALANKRQNNNPGYTIYASGCTTYDAISAGNFTNGIPYTVTNDGSGNKRLSCSSFTLIDSRFVRTSENFGGAPLYFGSGVQSINITNTSNQNNRNWSSFYASPPSGHYKISTSGSPNISITNASDTIICNIVPSTGNITLVNSALTDPVTYGLTVGTGLLQGNNSYIYLSGDSKINPVITYEGYPTYNYNRINQLLTINNYTLVSEYPNTNAILASGNYTLAYSGYPAPRTLYFNNAVDNNVLTSGNWWNDSSYTSAASALPLPIDNVIMSGVSVTDAAQSMNFNSLTAYDASIDGLVSTGPFSAPQYDAIIVVGSGGLILNGSSSIGEFGLINTKNNIVLNNTSYINGTALGAVGIYGSGSFNANDDSKYIGDASKIFLATNWNGLDGWDGADSIYYIGGRPTALDSSGNGWDSYTNTYYLNGIATTLDSNGSGFYDGHAYYYASLQPTGWNGYYYYVDDVQTTLDQYAYGSWNGLFYTSYPYLLTGWDWSYYSGYYIDGILTALDYNGSGFWEGHAYYNGYQQPTGYNGYYYYINDVETSLDGNGSGFWDGHAYYYGGLQPTGWNDYGYYIDDVLTDLDSSGTGNWDGYYWYNGVRQVVGSVFTGADGDWDNLANWIDTNGYTATELPNSGTDITVTTSITTIATQNPTVNSLVVENTAIISIDITVTTSSIFNDSSSYSGAYHLYSDTVIFNDSSSAGGNIHPTTSITFNNNSSASGLALDPLRVYLEPGYLNITGFPINPTSLNISNDTANGTNSTSFSRAGLGVNGSNILGLI